MLPSEVAARVEAVLGERATVIEELTPPWGAATRTVLVAAAGSGREVIIQWCDGPRTADRRALARRLRLGRVVAGAAPWLPLPLILGGEVRGHTPFVVSRYVRGASARDFLEGDTGAALVGAAAGRLSREIARVPTAGLRLSRTWAYEDRLSAAAGRWLRRAATTLDPASIRRVRATIETLPGCFRGCRPVFAHGDLAPVNLLIEAGRPVALLDLERARFAHPLFDAAWWRLIVRCHHPTIWQEAVGAFATAAGLGRTPVALARLDSLAILQCLENLAVSPKRSESGRQWVECLLRALDWGSAF